MPADAETGGCQSGVAPRSAAAECRQPTTLTATTAGGTAGSRGRRRGAQPRQRHEGAAVAAVAGGGSPHLPHTLDRLAVARAGSVPCLPQHNPTVLHPRQVYKLRMVMLTESRGICRSVCGQGTCIVWFCVQPFSCTSKRTPPSMQRHSCGSTTAASLRRWSSSSCCSWPSSRTPRSRTLCASTACRFDFGYSLLLSPMLVLRVSRVLPVV